ncbi:MAG: methyltransferase family protein [Burkholderiaceae bacterium]
MTRLELKIPPVVLSLAFAGAMSAVAALGDSLTLAIPWGIPMAVGTIAAGVAFALAGVDAFRRARTTVDPREPAKSSAMVTAGVYRWSRNPMYVGFLLVLTGWAIFLANAGAALLLPAFVAYMNHFQIGPEERALSARFGDDYLRYVKSVRRWL